ncbi:MAG TPA: hypothetical protein VK686_08445 [Bryobacteraceae bacterium]|nr:hypothetical protein [Bryobacteraceae bacterium]
MRTIIAPLGPTLVHAAQRIESIAQQMRQKGGLKGGADADISVFERILLSIRRVLLRFGR